MPPLALRDFGCVLAIRQVETARFDTRAVFIDGFLIFNFRIQYAERMLAIIRGI